MDTSRREVPAGQSIVRDNADKRCTFVSPAN